MKTILSYFLSFLLLTGIISACTDQVEPVSSPSTTYLKIETLVEGAINRAHIDSLCFMEGDRIGVFVRDMDGNPYSPDCINQPATYEGGQWIFTSPILLEEEKPALVYAYYPYDAAANAEGDSLSIHLAQQTDILYGNAMNDVTVDNPTARIYFKHALSRITLSLAKAIDDAGEGKLNKVRIRNSEGWGYDYEGNETYIVSDYVALEGRMNFINGGITRMADETAELELTPDTLLTEQGIALDFLLMPVVPSFVHTPVIPSVNVLLTIDGKEYLKSFPRPYWEGGMQYVYPITIRRSEPIDDGSDTDDGTDTDEDTDTEDETDTDEETETESGTETEGGTGTEGDL